MADSQQDTIIPAKYAKLVWMLFSVASIVVGTVEGVLIIFYGHDAKPVAAMGVVATGVAGILRLLTTNSFNSITKPLAVFLVLGALAGGASSCALFKPELKHDLTVCGTNLMQAEVTSVMPDVARALQGDSVNWQAQLDGLVSKAGNAAVCALFAIVSNIESGSGGAGAGVEPTTALPNTVILTRAYSYTASRNLR